jgi:hypothetical protein
MEFLNEIYELIAGLVGFVASMAYFVYKTAIKDS